MPESSKATKPAPHGAAIRAKTPPKPRGRPAFMDGAQRKTFRITAAHFEALAAWGNGNASEGLRQIIEAKLKRQKSPTD